MFELVVQGLVKEPDVTGALFSWTAQVYPKYSIPKLQNQRKVGKIDINLRQTPTNTQVVIQIPVAGTKIQASVIAAILLTLTRVSVYDAKIRLTQVVESGKDHTAKILANAAKIYTQHFSSDKRGSQVDLLEKLEQLVSQKKSITLGTFTLGGNFYNSAHIILTQGRRDVNLLGKYQIHNTLGVGGLSFPQEKLTDLLGDKRITLMLDGDKGGLALRDKVCGLFPETIDYVVNLRRGTSVEDLSKDQLLTAISEKQPYLRP